MPLCGMHNGIKINALPKQNPFPELEKYSALDSSVLAEVINHTAGRASRLQSDCASDELRRTLLWFLGNGA